MPDLVFETEPYDGSGSGDDSIITVVIDGEEYRAQRPQDHLLEELTFVMSQLASGADKGYVMRRLLQDCLLPEDWIKLKARMDDRSDSLRSYVQLVPAVVGICREFGTHIDDTDLDLSPDAAEPAPANRQERRAAQYGRPQRANAQRR